MAETEAASEGRKRNHDQQRKEYEKELGCRAEESIMEDERREREREKENQ
jgi:hypothetical protein